MKNNLPTSKESIAMIAVLSRARFLLLASSALVLLAQSAGAATTDTWSGASSAEWNTAGNWSGGIPGVLSNATFSNNMNTSVTVTGPASATGIIFTGAGTGAFTIGTVSGGTISLSSAGAISTDSTVANSETVNAPLVIGGSSASTYFFTSGATSASNVLKIGGSVTGATSTSATVTLTLNGANTGTNTVSGIIGDGGNGGKLAISKSGAGTWLLTNANTYSGGTVVSAGTLGINGSTAIGTGTLSISGGTIDNTSGSAVTNGNNNTVNVAGDFAFGGSNDLNLGSGNVALNIAASGTRTLTLNGTHTLTLGAVTGSSTTNPTLTVNGAGNTLVFGSYVLDTSSATGLSYVINGTGNLNIGGTVSAVGTNMALNYSGTGTLTLGGTNTYAGTTSVKQGTVIAGANVPSSGSGAFGNSATVINLGSTTAGQTGSAAILAASGVTVSRGITELASSLNSALIIGGSNNSGVATFTGPIILKGNATATTLTSVSGGEVDFNGAIIDFTGTSNSLIINGGGNVKLSGPNTYTGTTTVSSGTLTAGAPIANTSVLATSVTATGSTHVINLASNPLTNGSEVTFAATTIPTGLTAGTVYYVVNSTSSTFQVSTTPGGTPVAFSTAGTALTVTNPGAFGTTTSAVVLGDANTTANGSSASLLMGGAFNNARAVTIANQATTGTYAIGGSTDNNASFSGLVTANQGFNVSQVATTGTNALSITGGITGASAGTKTVNFANIGAVNVSTTAISDGATGNLAVAKSAAGTTTFSAVNTYTGGTTVTAGKLYVNSGVSGTSSGLGSGAVSVTGGTLAGTGNITASSLAVSGSGVLGSGGAQSGSTVDNTHLTLTNTSATITSAALTFSLGDGTTAGQGSAVFSTPNTNTTYLKLAGTSTLSFSGSDTINLVDLTNGALSLRLNTPYLLVQAASNIDYLNLVINAGTLANPNYVLSQNAGGLNGNVIGVLNGGSITSTSLSGATITAINLAEFGPDGTSSLANGTTADPGYFAPSLYLNNGDLEVVPEPSTWALMISGFAVLIVWQRRKRA